MTAHAAADDHGADAAQMPFIKNLASSDRKLREQSLAAIEAFLGARASSLSPADARRLWTGLFFALWMTDRPRPQQRLAAALADLLFALAPPSSSSASTSSAADVWLRAFWAVLSAQWPRIDALRLDKFLLLVRRVFAAHVRWARERGFPQSQNDDVVVQVLRSACFDVGEHQGVALGVRLHALDVWVDELEREGALQPAGDDADLDERRADFVARVGGLVDELRRDCPVKSVRRRAEESHADPRLPWAPAEASGDEAMGEADDDDDEEDGWGGIQD